MLPLVKIENLVKRFPVKKVAVWAVSGIDFFIERGETLGLVGESGSGKTTTGRCLLRLIEPDEGRVFFDGQDITELRKRELRSLRPRMQMVFQYPYRSLDPRMTVEGIVEEPLKLLGKYPYQQRKRKVRELIHQVGLEGNYLKLYPHQMSAGVQQRVAIARAIATDPDFVVLDEPVSALDITIRGEILDLLSNLQQRIGLSYLYISHDLTTVEHFCDRVAVMYLSMIVEEGRVDDVFKYPRHPYSRALLSSYLPPDPFVERSQYLLSGEIPSVFTLPRGCFLYSRCPEARPECGERRQTLESVGDGHLVACWRVLDGQI